MVLKIAVSGAHGRVGQCLIQMLNSDTNAECIASVVRQPKTTTEVTLQNLECFNQIHPDCFIDFSTPGTSTQILHFCHKAGIPLVIGTTGFTEVEIDAIHEASAKIPIILAPNMSIGMNLLYKLSEISSLVLKNTAEIAILDIHHKHKKDAPSGTALKLKKIIESATQIENKVLATATDKSDKLDIASLRIGNTLGEHKVWFKMDDEEILLSHKTLDRMVYAKGALLAAKWLVQQKPSLYDMHDVLDLNWIMKKGDHV
jgi:4-hydroxy-tetrahydrodipicolinate reductase